jgi:hypothetical protein
VKKTTLFLAVAALLVTAAAWIEPEAARPGIFSDQGQTFFPDFRTAAAVKAIEVVDYDETEAVARPLKVELRKGRWMLTSHGDYPAEARDRLANTSAALLDLKKDAPVSDRFEDHALYGVIDPLDTRNASLTGRGKRVTLKDAGGITIAELVLGHQVKDKPGYRYVRLPGQKRTYGVKTNADPSAQFADWVETNLLRISTANITRLMLNSYQIDEQLGRLVNQQRIVYEKDKPSWNAQAQAMSATLASLRVAGARPKPPQLAEQLRSGQLALTLETVMSLRQRGFMITPNGQLLSNEGELIAETSAGVNYTIRFGEIASDSTATGAKSKENRYVFVTVIAKNPEAEPQAKALMNKFSDWYYIVTGPDFAKLHPTRTAPPKAPPQQQPPPPKPPLTKP